MPPETPGRPPLARDACTDDVFPVNVRVGPPKVRPHVVAASGRPETALGADDLVTSFLVVWQPSPPPPPLWVRFLREAPFGTRLVRASDLHWDGKYLSIELLDEKDIEAYAAQMAQWVDYANTEIAHCPKSPAALALKAAQKRAEEIENRLRR